MKTTSVVVRLVAMVAVLGGALFGLAGTFAWPAAWGYITVVTVVIGVYGLVVLPTHPELVEERRHPPADAKRWDRPCVAAVAVLGPAALIVLSGLDRRYGWSPDTPAWLQVAGLAIGLVGGMFTNYAVTTNPFFSAIVRIRRDRGHHVIEAGPYRFIRHQGYAGSIVYMLGTAASLGSRVAVAATVALSLVLVVRTALEDRTLQAELEGYAAYATRVRYRLLPGVW